MASAEVTDKVASMTIEGDQGEKTPQKSDGLYTSESRGSDESGDGTPKVPYKTILMAMRRGYIEEPYPTIYQDPKPDSEAAKSGKLYEEVAKSQLKKMTKLWQQEVRKAAEKAKRDAEAAEAQAKRAEEAKKITIGKNRI